MANANFTPDIGPYTTLKPFRFWCQKVLPLVYDDSLSYYELLGKVVDYLNRTMEDVDTVITDIQGLLSAYEALQSWVNAYYTSADFAAAIDDGLDRMAESGQLTALINAIIAPQLPDIVDLLLPETVMTLLPDEVSSQIGGTVATQLPGVVSNQIPGTVATQLPAVVSNQIPGTVATQLPAVVSNQIGPVVEDKIVDPVENWLDANVSGGIAVDRTLSVLGAGADAAFTGARLETLDNTLGYDHVDDTGFFITTTEPYAFNYEFITDNAEFSDQGSHTYKMLVIPVNTGDKYCINAHKISIANVSENHFAVTYAFCAKYIGDPQTDIPYYLPTTYSANDAENVIATVPEIVIPTGQYYDETTGYLIVITANIEDPVYKVTGSDYATKDYVDDEIDAVTETVEGLTADLAGKADVDGTYPYLTAGTAQQLTSDQVITDQRPYLFRRTGADATREFDKLVGGSVVGNQLVNDANLPQTQTISDITFTNNGNGSITVSGTASDTVGFDISFVTNVPTGHKIMMYHGVSGGSWGTYTPMFNYNGVQIDYSKPGAIYDNSNTTVRLRLQIWTGNTVNFTIYPQVFDLTQMFGSSIADHAYTLEQATAGSGIAWLKSYGFFAGYQAYNAGAMVHVSGVSAHVMTGKNMFDPSLLKDQAAWNTFTLQLLPNTYYVMSGDTDENNMLLYFSTGGFSAGNQVYTGHPVFILTGANGLAYIQQRRAGETASFADCHVQMEFGTTPTAYEPYTVNSYTLDDTLTLRGILKLSNGEIYYDGDTYASDGTVTRKYGIRAYQAGDESLTDAITDGTNTVYKLTTPTTEAATPYQSPQICDPDGTEQYITSGIPVGHETQYPANLKGAIERIMIQVPAAPAAAGTYVLTCTVNSSGSASYEWAASTGRTLGAIRPVDQIQDQIREPEADPEEIQDTTADPDQIQDTTADPDQIQDTTADPDQIQDTTADPE